MPVQRSEFSHFLHERRLVINQRWKEILSNAYLSRATLHRIRHGDPHHPIAEVDSLRSLANALQFKTWADLVAAFEARDIRAGLPTDRYGNPWIEPPEAAAPPAPEPSEDPVLSLSRALNVTPTELVRRLGVGTGLVGAGPGNQTPFNTAPARPSLPRSLRMDEMRPARLVAHFTSGVAASRRVEKIEDEDHESKQPVSIEDARAFSIPVDGDCQDPVWKNGEIVVFSFDAYDREGILPGKSYYLAFTDGSTTFKRVFVDETDHEVYILRCWNTNKYPNERRVHFSEVVRIARAVSKQVVPAEE